MPLELKTPRAISIEYEMKFHKCKKSKKLSTFGSSNSLTTKEKKESQKGFFFFIPVRIFLHCSKFFFYIKYEQQKLFFLSLSFSRFPRRPERNK